MSEVKRSVLQRPDDPIDSFVVPLAVVTLDTTQSDLPVRVESVEGTGFLVANGRGLGVTARHVAKALRAATSVPERRLAVAMFVDPDGNFRTSCVGRFEMHPTEDVALFRLADDDYLSPFSVTTAQHFASMDYQLWAYPDDVRHDYLTEQAKLLNVPLVFSAGHIRRRISAEVHSDIPGSKFFELSDPAGSCCSGAPVTTRRDPWQVIGVYVGERRNFANTFAVGYATRGEALFEQWPQLVDGSTDLSGLCPFDSIDADWERP